jgi:hypothetical protein
MHEFLKARHLWEPGSSLTIGEFSLFRLLPKVSGANVRWTEHDSYLSFSQKSLNWHFLAWPRPSQATQYSSGMESPRDFQTCDQGWLLLVLRQLPCALLKAIVRAFLATNPLQQNSQRTLAIWYASQSQSRRTSYLWVTTSSTAQKRRGWDAQ